MARNYLRPHEVESAKYDKAVLEHSLKHAKLESRANAADIQRSLRAVNNRLEKQSPPVPNAKQRDLVSKRLTQLREEIPVGMPSHEEMRRCPPGAVAAHRKWEKANKAKVLEFKNLSLAMMPGASQEDVSAALNISQFRPVASQLNMENAVIPKAKTYMLPTAAYGEAWDRIFGKDKTPEEPMAVEALEAVPIEDEISELERSLDASFGAATSEE